MERAMFSEPLKKQLINHFERPLRYKHLSVHAAKIMETTRYTVLSNFIKNLQESGIFKVYKLKAKNKKTVTLYTSSALNNINPYHMAIGICPEGYFCNLSSIYYHALTNQIPSSIYICNETIAKRQKPKIEDLSNYKIRTAFIKPHRYTNNVFAFKKYEIVVIDREKDSRHGVVSAKSSSELLPKNSFVTSLERSLIDAVVSPQYNGGITSVYKYFEEAKNLNIDNLLKIYRKLDFVYPYSQTIGFFFEKLGMKKKASAIYDVFPPKQKFYIDRNAKASWEYDNKWQLYYPKELIDKNR